MPEIGNCPRFFGWIPACAGMTRACAGTTIACRREDRPICGKDPNRRERRKRLGIEQEDGGAGDAAVFDSQEGLVGLFEGEGGDLGLEADLGGDAEEFAAVSVGDVGGALEGAFGPEEVGVVHRGDGGFFADGIDDEFAALLEVSQDEGDGLANGGKIDHFVHSLGRGIFGVSGPVGAEAEGLLLMGFIAAEGEDFAVGELGFEDLDGQVGGGAEAEEADGLAVFDLAEPQGAIADDAGTQEGCGVEVVERVGEQMGEGGGNGHIFGIAAVDIQAGPKGLFAEVFEAACAERAGSAGFPQPGDTDAVADLEAADSGAFGDDTSDDLMAENAGQLGYRQAAFDFVQFGMADAADADLQEEFVVSGLRVGQVEQRERLLFDGGDFSKCGGFHFSGPFRFSIAAAKVS